ncbi:MAG: GFA family protein [Lysobacteraceae bacterium]
MTHHGSCHCGRIAFDLEGDVNEAIDCNCSMCRRRGALLAFFPREALTLKTPEADYATYRFNSKRLAHHFCPNCGIAPFSEGAHPKTGAMMATVNVRCLADLDLSTLSVKPVDGASL